MRSVGWNGLEELRKPPYIYIIFTMLATKRSFNFKIFEYILTLNFKKRLLYQQS